MRFEDLRLIRAIGKNFDLKICETSHADSVAGLAIDSQCVDVRCNAGCDTSRCHTMA